MAQLTNRRVGVSALTAKALEEAAAAFIREAVTAAAAAAEAEVAVSETARGTTLDMTTITVVALAQAKALTPSMLSFPIKDGSGAVGTLLEAEARILQRRLRQWVL